MILYSPRLLPILSLLLTLYGLSGCDTVNRQRVEGTYQLIKDDEPGHSLGRIELTPSKCILSMFMVEVANDYKIDDKYIYTTVEDFNIRIKIVSSDTLRVDNVAMMDGTFVRTEQPAK